jgi:hypothetical protein
MKPFSPGAVVDDDQRVAPETSAVGLFHDIPVWVWRSFLLAWATLFGLFVLFFARGAATAFVIAIVIFFVLMAFGLPMTMAAQAKCERGQCNGMIDTRTGPLTITAAATQIILIPVAAVVGLVAFIIFAL